MRCDKCGGEKHFDVKLDSRGVASIFCADCGAFVKKASTVDVLTLYEEKLAEAGDFDHSRVPEKQVCPYCTERYFLRYGRLGTTYTPIEAKYCPMCGRELKASDRAY